MENDWVVKNQEHNYVQDDVLVVQHTWLSVISSISGDNHEPDKLLL